MTIVEVDGKEIVTEHSDGIGWEPPLPGPFALEAGVWLTIVGSVLLLFRPARRSRAAFLASRVHDL
jgi:hypothetical protein